MSKEEVFNIIVCNTCEVLQELKDHQFRPDDQLADLGANSVDRAEIVAMTMEALSLNIPRVDLSRAKNIGELAEVLYEKLQSA